MKAIIWATLAATTALSAAQTSARAAGEPYLIGLIAGTTGAYGSTGVATVNGAQMAVDKINASGGVLGRQLKLDPHNDDASATVSGQLYEKFIAAGAIAIAGSPDTGPVTAQLAIRHKFPTIGVVDDGGLTVNTEGPNGPPNPWVFDFGLNTFAWGEKIGEYALKHCPDGIAVLHDPSTYGQGGLYGIQLAYDKAGKKIGIDHTITENWSTGATTGLMPEVNAAKGAGIKCIDAWLTPQDQAAFVQDLHSAGYNATVFGNDETNSDDTFSKLAGDIADGTISAVLDLRPPSEPRAHSIPRRIQEEVQHRSDALRRNELRQHHDAGAGRQRHEVDQTGGPAEGVQLRQELQGHHRRSRLLGEEPHHDQRRPADARQI